MKGVNLLINHYSKLLEVEEDNYQSLVKNAYQTQDNYEAFLRELTAIEKEIDRAVIERLGETAVIVEPMLTKQKLVDELRTKGVSKFFLEAREG